jgi:hypothetical protein
VRGAAAAAGFAHADDEEKHLPPLWRAAAAFRGACVSALEGPASAVSASFAWRRAFAVVAAGADAGGAAKAPRATHGGFANWSAWDAREGEETRHDEDEEFQDGSFSSAFETVVFHAGAASADGRHSVGLLALRDGVPEKALAMELPEGQEIVDAAAYTNGRVLALCQPAGGADADPSRGLGPASVVMLDPREATRGDKSSSAAGAFGFVALARRDDADDTKTKTRRSSPPRRLPVARPRPRWRPCLSGAPRPDPSGTTWWTWPRKTRRVRAGARFRACRRRRRWRWGRARAWRRCSSGRGA